ncbi:hypothetical protein IU500_01050 [Nocardia terpenica]|uniref:hypothetical protein n=1 Tax=Nocardia terpenica TaxID=455432 RepID=UPI0018935E3F|nr:hypothetical protein [Nocardia terpenica]MBF6059837.1 hypothetical protein [Nocardia terpenica]MBF6102622.1 hypothetical protein [Nocardia terpenica]MBF6111187.1 hypothetical protein [Nocardia terpenica]MBF6117318.1 hypothetical protein [Nocardia terpenica]MBF6150841.1 hypothetical protein [Nocardia terpenica]
MDDDVITAARSWLEECRHKREKLDAEGGRWTDVDRKAYDTIELEILAAERKLAQVLGQQYAVVLDLDIVWDTGAPMPFVVCDGCRAAVVFYLPAVDSGWDGTYVTIVDPASGSPKPFGVIEFEGVYEIKFGGLNDEAIGGHPLDGNGLVAYAAHEVINSQWIAEAERRNSIHPRHVGGWHTRMKHYVLCFHDETLECLASGLRTRQMNCSYRDAVHAVTTTLLGGPAR